MLSHNWTMKIALSIATLLLTALRLSPPTPRTPSFREATIPVGKGPKWITVADVNQDGKPDLLITNADSGTLSVLLGDGKGQFRPSQGSPFPAGHLPNDIAIGDMNGDGHPDLVIADHQSPYLTILLGDGRGGFQPAPGSPIDVHSNPHPHGVVVGDFSGNGKLDVVTDSWANNQIELLQGDGKGALRTPGTFFQVGRRPYERLRSADFNQDGHPDIVTTNLDDDTVTILLGDGQAHFRQAPGSPFAAGAKPWEVAIDDINGDENPDLIIIPYDRDVASEKQIAVTVLLGDGHGGFAPMAGSPLPLTGCRGANSVATGDVNGDGFRDIVVSCALSKELFVFLGSGNNRFTAIRHVTQGGWGAVAIADLNGDGKSDIVHANDAAGSITIYFSN